MRVYGYPNTRSIRVLWALEELDAAYTYIQIDLKAGDARRPPFLQINPGGKVPALVDGNLVLTESLAICAHIAEKFRAKNLLPHADPIQRARVMQWCSFALTELEQPVWTLTKHTFALPEKYRVAAIMDTARWEFARAANVLQQGLAEREFIVGDEFTIADILLAHTLEWALARSLDLGHEDLENYRERMHARPALQRALQRELAAG